MGITSRSDAYTRAAEAIPSCSATAEALESQRRRAARLSKSLKTLRRRKETVTFEFQAGFDVEALTEMVSIERECCPFFTFDFDQVARRLTVGVQDVDYLPALEAMAEQLGALPH